MITFKFKNQDWTFSGFNCEASVDDGMVYINADKNDYQFSVELPSSELKTYTKNDENVSIYFSFPSGDEYSAYFEDDADTEIAITLSANSGSLRGTIQATLSGENGVENLQGSFNLSISN